MLFKHTDAARLLIAARADLEGGMPAMAYAALSNNPEGVRLLCAAGANPLSENLINIPMFDFASAYASSAAVEAFLMQAPPETLDISQALWASMWSRGGTAEMVDRLVGLRADVNHQRKIRQASPLDELTVAKSQEHRSGRTTVLTAPRIEFVSTAKSVCCPGVCTLCR